jgi:hypothetical protein
LGFSKQAGAKGPEVRLSNGMTSPMAWMATNKNNSDTNFVILPLLLFG